VVEHLLEYVTMETALLRHPNMEAAIRKFFTDAGKNSVRAFYSDQTGLGGYVFYEITERASTPGGDEAGRYYKLVTTCEVTTQVSPSGDTKILRPTKGESEKISRQFSNHEWFTGRVQGRFDRVAAVDIAELEAPIEESE
jgi:hypothetical protein